MTTPTTPTSRQQHSQPLCNTQKPTASSFQPSTIKSSIRYHHPVCRFRTYVREIINKIKAFFQRLFGLSKPAPSTPPQQTVRVPMPVVLPKKRQSLQKEKPDSKPVENIDPFQEALFTKDAQGNLFIRDQISFDKVKRLYEIFSYNPSWWLWYKKEIETLAEELKDLPPLHFLYYVFYDQAMTQNATSFFEKGKNIEIEGETTALEKALQDLEEKFKTHAENTLKQLSGFATFLELHEKDLIQLATEGKWQNLILHVFTERKKQFNL